MLGIEDDESARRREEAEHKERMVREAEVMRLRYDTARQEWSERREEIQECINSVDGCIEILFPPEDEWTTQDANGREGPNKTADGTTEEAVVDNAENVKAESASENEEGAVEWEEDDTQQAQPQPNTPEPATASDSADLPAADEDDWEELYLRTGGSTRGERLK